jgi:GNAT superfamily N-acetyltransferase
VIKNKYANPKQLEFEKLKNRYLPLLNEFQTYQPELKKYLVEDALNGQGHLISNTYLIFDKNNFIQFKTEKETSKLFLLGYVTIANDNITLNADLKTAFGEKGINYKWLPALKMARLCIDDRYLGRNLGRLTIAFCIKRACYLNQASACRFITLDAKRHHDINKDSLHFYRKMGFEILEHKDKSRAEMMKQKSGQSPMYLDIAPFIK